MGRSRHHQGGGSRPATLATIKVAVAVVLAWPVMAFVGEYVWTYRTLDGLVPALVLGFVESIPDQVAASLHEPVKAVALMILTAMMIRFARGRHR